MLVRTPRILWMNLSILRSSTGCEVFTVPNGVRSQWCRGAIYKPGRLCKGDGDDA
jgi:hypothetical protein